MRSGVRVNDFISRSIISIQNKFVYLYIQVLSHFTNVDPIFNKEQAQMFIPKLMTYEEPVSFLLNPY